MTKTRLTKQDFDLVRFPNGEFKLMAIKTFSGEINWKYGDTFANGEKLLSPSEELVALFQLDKLAKKLASSELQKVYADFLPFKRQDKDKLIGESKFNDIYNEMIYIELHEAAAHDTNTFAPYILGKYAEHIGKDDLVVFPDFGARERFKNIGIPNNIVSFEKHRDAKTGRLEFGDMVGYGAASDTWKKEYTEPFLEGVETAVILDDICAYGGTFKYVASQLKEKGINTVKLVINHADTDLKGKLLHNPKEMKEAGIDELIILNGGI